MELLEKLKTLLGLTDDTKNALLLFYLALARNKLLDRLFPYDSEKDLPKRYELKQVEIAGYLYSKQGAEGETSHSENGVSRSYESADVPESMMRGVTPFVGVL